ncbi:MAG: glucokinase [Deltaproteobacteria bacterium]|nr:glucokinase [Deltaproteobacteria bacterium]
MKAERAVILAGDIGGTKTNLALFSVQGHQLTALKKTTFLSKRYPAVEPILAEFLAQNLAEISSSCLAIAGPVIGRKSKTPNLCWLVDADEISRSLNLGSVVLINDLEATAYGLFALHAGEFIILNPGAAEPKSNMAVIAAGTGLGEAFLFWNGARFCPSASEGGHADFAPRDALQIELLRYLESRFGHVSYERVISGPGLLNIYDFLRDSGRFSEPSWLREKFSLEDPSAVISEVALSGKAEICVRALDLFVSVYGAEAGNLALKGKATGGVYVGGGIAPKITEKLKDGIFLEAFVDKGRYKEFLSGIPVKVIMNEEAALMGAAYYAAFR